MLLQVLDAIPDATGIGVDTDIEAISHGRSRAEQRGLSERVQLHCTDARTGPDVADAVICIGASQIWGAPVEDAQPLDYAAALGALRALVPRGGQVLYGECIWSQPPTPLATAVLAGRDDECVTLPELLELCVAHGFAVLDVHTASLDEWDHFESGYAARYTRWLADHDGEHPERGEVLQRAAQQRSAYFGGYRNILGLAYVGLIAV